MSKSVYVSLLRQGNTGNEILSILDTLVDDNLHLVDGRHRTEALINSIPTLEELSF